MANNTDRMNDQQKEKLKKEQKKLRKTGIILFCLAVVVMLFATAVHYTLVGVSGLLGAIGGIMIARSYVHHKYR